MMLIFWMSYDTYKQQSLVRKGTKLPSMIFKQIDDITSQTLPKDKSFQILFFFSPSKKESIWAAKSLNMVKSWLPRDFKIFAIAQNFKSIEEITQFRIRHLGVETFLGYQRNLTDYKITKVPMFYFVNPQGTITGSTLGFTTPLGILIRAYFSYEDNEENKWYLKL
jgi:hypothetical protein